MIDLSKCRSGDMFELRDGRIVTLMTIIKAFNRPYMFNHHLCYGVTGEMAEGVESPADIVKIIKSDCLKTVKVLIVKPDTDQENLYPVRFHFEIPEWKIRSMSDYADEGACRLEAVEFCRKTGFQAEF